MAYWNSKKGNLCYMFIAWGESKHISHQVISFKLLIPQHFTLVLNGTFVLKHSWRHWCLCPCQRTKKTGFASSCGLFGCRRDKCKIIHQQKHWKLGCRWGSHLNSQGGRRQETLSLMFLQQILITDNLWWKKKMTSGSSMIRVFQATNYSINSLKRLLLLEGY